MQKLKLLSLLLLSALSWGACSNNNAAVGASGSAPPATTEGMSGSGDDMYYEYTITTTRTSLNMNGYTKLYVSSGGKVRSEMDMNSPARKDARRGMIVLIANKDKPGQSISIDDSAKTYTVNIIDTGDIGGGDAFKMTSTVTKVGEEKIMGFNCVHARVLSTRNMGPLGSMADTIELWNSPDVPLAPFFRYYMDKNVSRSWTSLMTRAATEQLKQMGCVGFMVKMQSGSKNSNLTMALTKVRKDNFAGSMFEIPAGYKEDKQ